MQVYILILQVLRLLVIVVVLTGLVESHTRKKRSMLDLLDLIDDYCESENVCIEDVSNDLIFYVSGEGYNEEEGFC